MIGTGKVSILPTQLPWLFKRCLHSDRNIRLSFDEYKPTATSSKQTLVLLHGFLGSKQNYRSLAKHFSRHLGIRVFAPDLRNHGSSPHVSPHSYSTMVSDLLNFLEEHKLNGSEDHNKPIILGHSMGAKVAMGIALKYPDLISRVISVDNAPIVKDIGEQFYKDVRAMAHVQSLGLKLDDPNALKKAMTVMERFEKDKKVRVFLCSNLIYSKNQMLSDPRLSTHFSKNITSQPQLHSSLHTVTPYDYVRFRVPLNILDKSLGALGDFPFPFEEHGAFKGKTLFIRAFQSEFVPEPCPEISKYFPNSNVITFNTGHWVISEKPTEFISTVTKFLHDEL